MPVRRVSKSRVSGYGSFGLTQTSPGLITRAFMKQEVRNMTQFLPSISALPEEPLYIFTFIAFRWKFTVGDINADLRKMFNAETGKSKLGTVIVEHEGYVCDEQYTSYAQQMSSRIYATMVMSAYSSRDPFDEIPCDEPPSDTPTGVVFDASFALSGWSPFLGNPPGASPSLDVCLGDTVTFYPEPCVQRYNFGGSYVYQHVLILAEQIPGGELPVILNL